MRLNSVCVIRQKRRPKRSKKMKIILPFRGEFGMKLMRHVPQVNAITGDKIVCCEPGEEAFYPSASSYEICDKNNDDNRRESYQKDSDFISNYTNKLRKKYGDGPKFIKTDQDMPCKYFIPKPYVDFGIKTDIVVCPRKRKYGAEKNWKHWPAFVKARVVLTMQLGSWSESSS